MPRGDRAIKVLDGNVPGDRVGGRLDDGRLRNYRLQGKGFPGTLGATPPSRGAVEVLGPFYAQISRDARQFLWLGLSWRGTREERRGPNGQKT